MADGFLIFKTKLDNSEFSKDIADTEKEIERLNGLLKQADEGFEVGDVDKISDQISNLENKLYDLKRAQDGVISSFIDMGHDADFDYFDTQINYLETKVKDLRQMLKLNEKNPDFDIGDINKVVADIASLERRIEILKEKKDSLNDTGMTGFTKSVQQATKSIQKSIKQITNMALAVFSLSSAYMMVRSAVSTLSQYNTQLASDIQYIKFALAKTLEPLITKIVNLVYTLLQYVNMLSVAWFGVNLFANANASAMNKASKSAEKMKKSLAGFDEVNILSNNKTEDSSSAAASPSVDLSDTNIEVPPFLQFMMDNGNLILALLAGIATYLTLIKFGVEGIMALGFGVIIAGVVLLVQDFLALMKDPTWQGIVAILTDIAIIAGGIMLLLGNWWGLLVAGIALLVRLIVENWDTIKGVLGTVGGWIMDHVITPVINFFTGLWDGIVNIFTGIVTAISDAWNAVKEWTSDLVSKIVGGVVEFFSGLWQKIKDIFNNIKNTISTIWNGIKSFFGTIIANIVNGAIDKFNNMKTTVIDVFNNIKNKVTLAWSTLVTNIKSKINTIISNVEHMINTVIDGINSWTEGIRSLGSAVISKLFGEEITINGISRVSMPRLASGGIVDVPNTGVRLGNAIVGEAGREGVLPLTDEKTMQELGREIGQWISINLNLTTELDGRVLNKRLEQIKNNNRFAMNRG